MKAFSLVLTPLVKWLGVRLGALEMLKFDRAELRLKNEGAGGLFAGGTDSGCRGNDDSSEDKSSP